MKKPPRIYTNYAYEEDQCIVRTVAGRHAAGFAPVPEDLAALADRLIRRSNQVSFPIDAVRSVHAEDLPGQVVPGLAEVNRHLREAGFESASAPQIEFDWMNISLAREVGFHHDEYYTDAALFFVWVLGLEAALTFHSLGEVLPLKAGSTILFDAVNIHALLRAGRSQFRPYKAVSTSPRMVFALATVPFTKAIMKSFAIETRHSHEVPSDWRQMRAANYSDRTGKILSFDEPALPR